MTDKSTVTNQRQVVYLAGPMRGITEYNFPAFHAAAAKLRQHGLEVWSPAENDVNQDGFDPAKDTAQPMRHYMKRDLPAVLDADMVCVLPGWENSQGASLEVHIAQTCGIPVYDAATMQPITSSALSENALTACSGVDCERCEAFERRAIAALELLRRWRDEARNRDLYDKTTELLNVAPQASSECRRLTYRLEKIDAVLDQLGAPKSDDWDGIHAELSQVGRILRLTGFRRDEDGSLVRFAPSAPAFDLIAHLRRQRDFSNCTFGPGMRTKGVIAHIRKELIEIKRKPTDVFEWIDVVLLALDGAWRAGYEPTDIAAALQAKQAKNEARNWPDWRTVSEDGPIEHDRTLSAQSAEAMTPAYWDIVFDGPPDHESGRFVECEDMQGRSFRAGDWIDRGNGLWALRIWTSLPSSAPLTGGTPMTELIYRLHNWCNEDHGEDIIENAQGLMSDAAEAIGQLERELAESRANADDWMQRYGATQGHGTPSATERKMLEKAKDVFCFIANHGGDTYGTPENMCAEDYGVLADCAKAAGEQCNTIHNYLNPPDRSNDK